MVSRSANDGDDERPRVLLVDDNADCTRALARILACEGFAVESAYDGASALKAMEEGPEPDFILTDLMLPDIDGREVARQARRLCPGAKVALLTGWADDDLDAMRGEPDLDFVFLKPVDVRGLLSKMRASYARAREQRRPAPAPAR